MTTTLNRILDDAARCLCHAVQDDSFDPRNPQNTRCPVHGASLMSLRAAADQEVYGDVPALPEDFFVEDETDADPFDTFDRLA